MSLLMYVGVVWILVLIVAPVFEIILLPSKHGSADEGFISIATDLAKPILNSTFYSSIAAILATALAVPIARVLVGGTILQKKWFSYGLFLPLFVNLLLRVYSLRLASLSDTSIGQFSQLLGREGSLIGSSGLMIVGLIYLYIPFAVIAIAVSLSQISSSSIEAGRVLGLRNRDIRIAVANPALLRGISHALVLTFVPAFGDYLVPAALGGAKVQMLASYLYQESILQGNLQAGAIGISFVWLTCILVFSAFYLIRHYHQYPTKNFSIGRENPRKLLS